MNFLSRDQLVNTLTLWQNEGIRGLCVFTTTKKFLFGVGEISEVSPDRIMITMTKVVKTLEVEPEEKNTTVASFTPADVVSAWHAPISNLQNPGSIGDYWDDSVHMVIQGDVSSVVLYRKSAFHKIS